MRKIIINADDFGLTEGINQAIEEAHTRGVLTSTTIMTNMPAADAAVDIAKRTPTLGLGIHLNLTIGRPLSNDKTLSTLTDFQGFFVTGLTKLFLKSTFSRKTRHAIETEFAAQIEWLLNKGLSPSHLDSHKHIHSFPTIFPIVARLAQKFNIHAIRWPFEPHQVSSMPWPLPASGGKKRAAILRATAQLNRIQNKRFFKNNVLLGIAHTGQIDRNFWRAVAKYSNFGPVTEVMTHPGYPDGLGNLKTSLLNQRKAELDSLCSDETKKFIKDARVDLVNYRQL